MTDNLTASERLNRDATAVMLSMMKPLDLARRYMEQGIELAEARKEIIRLKQLLTSHG